MKFVMSPVELTNESTCQLALGPRQRFQVWPAMDSSGEDLRADGLDAGAYRASECMRQRTTGEATYPPFPQSLITISYEDAEVAGSPEGALPNQMS